jgi:tetratricopeptide (TPR) repeat protein
LAIDPEFDLAWCAKGNALSKGLGKMQEALVCYERAIGINPQNAEAWNNKGATLFYGFQRIREALECFQEAERLGYVDADKRARICE